MAKGEKKRDIPNHCTTCHQVLKATCSDCFQMVFIRDSKFVGHDRVLCLGTHLEYKTCPGSKKEWHPG